MTTLLEFVWSQVSYNNYNVNSLQCIIVLLFDILTALCMYMVYFILDQKQRHRNTYMYKRCLYSLLTNQKFEVMSDYLLTFVSNSYRKDQNSQSPISFLKNKQLPSLCAKDQGFQFKAMIKVLNGCQGSIRIRGEMTILISWMFKDKWYVFQ